MADNNIVYKITVDAESGTAVVRDLKGQIVATQVPVKELKKEFKNLSTTVNATQFNKFKSNLKSATKAKDEFTKKTGGASSAVLELGRVVQDSNYGIRGMANNITQFASQMAFAVKSAGGFGKALKDMGKAMMGPLGVVFAISVLVALLEKTSGKAKEASKLTDALSKSFGEQSTKLMVLRSALENSNISLETKTEIVKKANEEFESLNISIDENGNISEETAKKIDLLSLSFIKNAKARAIASLIQEEMVKQAKIEGQVAGENLKWYEVAYYGLQSRILGTTSAMSNAVVKDTENKGKAIEESQKLVDKYIKMLTDKDGELAEELFGNTRKKRTKRKKATSLDIFGLPAKDYDLKKELDDANTFWNIGKKLGIFTQEQYDEAMASINKNRESNFLVTGVAPELSFELSEGTKKGIKDYNDKVTKEILKGYRNEEIKEALELFQQGITSITDFIGSEYDREITIEQNKTNALNEELNNRLLNESLSKDKRAEIQNQIAINDEALRKKQEVIEKKRFQMQKMSNIAQATISTYLAGAKVLEETKGGSFARIAGMIVTIGAGLAQVAAISRQKFQSSSASTPIRTSSGGGAGSGGVGDRSFDFNLVGATQGNQVLDAIQGQFNKPVQAYVVSRDMTSQQQLDANIKNQASF